MMKIKREREREREMIKNGTTAWDLMSRQNEKTLRSVVRKIRKDFPDLSWKHKLSPDEIYGGKGACSPDGGIFYLKGRAFLALEAKKQGDTGNAVERWCKNADHIRRLSGCSLLSFFTGEGAPSGCTMSEILNSWHYGVLGRWDHYFPGGNSTFRSKDLFDFNTMYAIVRDAIQLELDNDAEADLYVGGW
jgi:hypothetical protein